MKMLVMSVPVMVNTKVNVDCSSYTSHLPDYSAIAMTQSLLCGVLARCLTHTAVR